jgi:hypothetical protein
MALGVAFTLTFLHFNANALEIRPGTDNYDAVLAGSTITSGDPILINGGLGLTSDTAMTRGLLVNRLSDFGDVPALLALNDFTPPKLFWTTTPLRHHYPEGRGSSVPDTGSTLLLLTFALAAIFAFKGPFSASPGKANLIKS